MLRIYTVSCVKLILRHRFLTF